MYNDFYNSRFNQPYMAPQQPQPYMMNYNNQMQTLQNTSTNKIYVSGVDDVRGKSLPPNSDYIFLDNDKPIIYQKTVDSKGQFEVKAFTITPYKPEEVSVPSADLSVYAKTSDLEALKKELQELKNKLGGQNGTAGGTTSSPTKIQ